MSSGGWSGWRSLWRRWSRPARDEAMEEELRFHVEMSTQRNLTRGMTPEQARRDALVRLGGLERTREAAWDVQRRRWLEDMGRDVRQALRQLRRAPVFAISAMLTLALGMGANVAIFSVLDAVLLRPLPYEAPTSLVSYAPGRYALYEALREGTRALSSSGAYTYDLANVTGGSEPVRVWTLAVTSTVLPVLGRSVYLGRGFEPSDDRAGAPLRVILRYGFWQTQFAGDPGIIGRLIELDGRPHEVIGVLPADLEFPPPARRSSGTMPRHADVWTGAGWLDDLYERGGFFAVGRLAGGRTESDATNELTRLANAWRPAGTDSLRMPAESVTESVVAPLRPAVLAFAGGVALVLLIACANLGSLQLARLSGRERELALRLSIGAGRGRIVRQILTEGGVLAVGGLLAGFGVAWGLLRALLLFAPAELVRVQQATLNARVLGFAGVLAALTTVFIGLLPALRTMRRDPREAMAGARSGTDRGTGRVHAALVAAEVAFAVVLLVGAGLLLRSFGALASVDPGFPSRGLITADLLIPPDRYPTRASVLQFFDALEQRLAARHGIASVSAIDRLPYGPSFSQVGFRIAGRAPAAGLATPTGFNTSARPGYLRAIGIPVLQGREFAAADGAESPPVVVIARTLADRYWPGGTAVGERIEVFGVEREIVGVAGDVRHFGPGTPVDPLIYLPQAQDVTTRRMMTVVVRATEEAGVTATLVRDEIRALDARLPISNLRSFDALRSERTAGQRFNAMLIASFALLAVTLAAVGIYGVTSFVVAQRRREIGLRMALGASRATVLRRFLGRSLGSVAAGVVAGTMAAWPLARLSSSLLFGIAPGDLATYLGVIALVSVVSALAALIPSQRAAGIPPRIALASD